MTFANDEIYLEENANLRAKLRNSAADLRWYAYKFARASGLNAVTEDNALELVQAYLEAGGALAEELKQILTWYARIQNATPQKANQLFYDCWRFVHNFDKKLRTL